MSLLSIIQNVSQDLGLASPTSVIGNVDQQVVQLLAIANVEGRDLASRYGWSRLIVEKTWTIVSGRDQGLINGTIVTTSDFDYLINGTVWNRTTQEPVEGPISEKDRQFLKSQSVTGPYERYWIQGGHLYLDPAPSGGDTLAFEYKSKHWCETTGGTGQAEWADDSDLGRLDEHLMELGIIWRWKKRKGLEYAEDRQDYESRILDAMNRDKSARTLNLNGRPPVPSVMAPSGNWNL